MPMLALPIISSVLGAAGSFLNQKPIQTANHSTSVRTTPTELQPIQSGLIQQLMSRMSDPTAGTGAIRMAGRNAINANYAGADQALRDKLLTTGDGTSGKYGTAQRQVETSRAGALSGFEGDIASLILGQQNNNLSLSERLLQQGQGTTTDSKGTQTQPNSPMGAALGSVGSSLGSLSTLMTLNKLLSGAGGGGAGGAGGDQAW